jgi:hypothetical protein
MTPHHIHHSHSGHVDTHHMHQDHVRKHFHGK